MTLINLRDAALRLMLLALLSTATHATAEEAPPDPLALYNDVTARIAAASAFSVHIEKRFDVLLPDGAKVQYSGALDILTKKAGALHLDYGDDVSAKEVWYDGTALTIIDHLSNVYAEVPATGKVGPLVVDIDERLGLKLPLTPLLRVAPGEFEAAVQSATYLGLHDAGGEPCHHALYRGANLDLQIWVTTGEEPLLRKLVVTFWQIEGAPQQSLEFSDWNLKARPNRRAFVAKIPDDAIRAEFLPVGEE